MPSIIHNDMPYFCHLFRWEPQYLYGINNTDGWVICWSTWCWGNRTQWGTLVWYVSSLVMHISPLRWLASSIYGLTSSLWNHQSTYIHFYVPCTAASCLCRFLVDVWRDFWVSKIRYLWLRPLFDANGACNTMDSAKYIYQVRVFPSFCSLIC